MNYEFHYNKLIERAKDRKLNCYVEKHHIIPRCMGGTNIENNLIELTPEEHYVAHQLLVKIYPNENGLVFAAKQMTNNSYKRNNKLYGWLKKKLSVIAKQRTGNKNGSFGTMWITNGIENKKVPKYYVLKYKWHYGRVKNKTLSEKDKKVLLDIRNGKSFYKAFSDNNINKYKGSYKKFRLLIELTDTWPSLDYGASLEN